jgi:hypothetical protein
VGQNQSDRGGVRLAVKYADRDSVPDIVAGSGELSTGRIRVYSGATVGTGATPTVLQDFNLFGDLLPGGVYVG